MSETLIAVHERMERTSLGFWLYLMTDCMLFASLFATFAVLRGAVAAGPSESEIFDMPMVLVETIVLLASSFACGIMLLGLKAKLMKTLLWSLGVTYVLGLAFLTIEISEFAKLIGEGHGWQQSAFLSAFFVLVGTHGAHILFGLVWLLVLVMVLVRRGITPKLSRQLTLFAIYWHFLDLVWIFVFTVVYLMGVNV